MDELPLDLKRLIVEYADDEELAKLCMLNKNFSTKVCNSSFWLNKIVDRFGLTPDEINRFKGKNTLWGYYKHLSEINEQYETPTRILELIYHHPAFKNMTKDIFHYSTSPKWLNKKLFEEETLYNLADSIYEYKDEEIDLRDTGTYDFLENSHMVVPKELFKYVGSL